MKLKKMIFLLLASAMVFGSFHLLFAQQNELNRIVSESSENEFSTDELNCVHSGNYYSTTGLEREYILNAKDGKYVYFYIENIGEATFSVNIGSKEKGIFKPGDKKTICIEIKNGFLNRSKEYAFCALPVEDSWGKEVKISYIIGQKDNKE